MVLRPKEDIMLVVARTIHHIHIYRCKDKKKKANNKEKTGKTLFSDIKQTGCTKLSTQVILKCQNKNCQLSTEECVNGGAVLVLYALNNHNTRSLSGR